MRITKFHKPILLTVIGLASLGLLLLAPRNAAAAGPSTVNFQGKVTNANGTNEASGTVSRTFVFRLYQNVNISTYNPNTTSCASDANCVWEETDTLNVTDGVFQVPLGAVCPLFTSNACNKSIPLNFNTLNSLSLTMKYNGDAAGFMTPLVSLQSVPYALNADNLGGLAAGNFVQLAQAIQTDSSTSNASIGINKTGGTANIITIQRGGTPVLVLDTNGSLTLSPNGNNVGTVVRQTSGTATSGNIFDIQGANGTSHFIQVAETAANAGSISITSLGSNAVTIDSGSGTVVFGSTTTTIQKAGAALTLDVSNGASNSQLNISNSGGAGNVTLNLDSGGSYSVGGTAGTTASACSAGQFIKGTLSGGIITSGSCASAYTTIQDEGSGLTQRSTINFTGTGVTCADNSGSTRTDCTISGGGGGSLASAYNQAATTGNLIQMSTAGGPIVLQDASGTSLTDFFTIQNNAGTFKYLNVTLASGVPHLQVFGASSTNYADIYYDAGTSTAYFKASAGTTQIGNSSGGAINIASGSGNAITITAGANSIWSTSAGTITINAAGGLNIGTSTATILIGQTSSGSTQVQSASGLTIGAASSVSGVLKLYTGASTGSIQFASGATYQLILPGSASSNNYCLANSATAGTLQWLPCGAGSTAAVTLTPEFPGAVMTGDGSSNTGTMTSDFCSNTVGSLPALATGCNSGQTHNFYQWTASATNDYEIFVKWAVPSDFSSFSSFAFSGFRTSASDAVTVTLYNAAGTSCGSGSIAGTVNTWNNNTAVTTASCSAPSPGDIMTIDAHLSVGVNNEFARMGEIIITYNRN